MRLLQKSQIPKKANVSLTALNASPRQLTAWPFLVSRSIAAWEGMVLDENANCNALPKSPLREDDSPGDFLQLRHTADILVLSTT